MRGLRMALADEQHIQEYVQHGDPGATLMHVACCWSVRVKIKENQEEGSREDFAVLHRIIVCPEDSNSTRISW
jgi:hypothetical protein